MATGIVLAHTMADHMKAELVTETIKKAKKRWNLPKGCIHHSDLGAVQTPNFGHYAAITSGFKSFLMIALWYSLGGLSLRLP